MKALCVFLAAVAAMIFYIVAVLCAKSRIEIEYKDASLRIGIRSRVFRYTFRGGNNHSKKWSSVDTADNSESTRGKGQKKRTSLLEALLKKRDKAPKSDSEPITAEGFFQRLQRLKKAYTVHKSAAEAFLNELYGKIAISDIRAELSFGTGNAAATGILYGAFWGMYGALYAYIRRFLTVDRPKLKISPDFKQKSFGAEAHGIITVRPVHIIFAAIKAYSVYKRETGKGIKDILRSKRNKNINTGSTD